jgi:hypothetical protein
MAVLAALGLLAGCAATSSAYDRKIAYLRADAVLGTRTHARLVDQGTPVNQILGTRPTIYATIEIPAATKTRPNAVTATPARRFAGSPGR